MVSDSGFGFAGSVQPFGATGVLALNPPPPPPCVVPGKKYLRTFAGRGMSALASVPTRFGDSRKYQNSSDPNVSKIFGQVRLSRHRSSSPAVGRRRTLSS